MLARGTGQSWPAIKLGARAGALAPRVGMADNRTALDLPVQAGVAKAAPGEDAEQVRRRVRGG